MIFLEGAQFAACPFHAVFKKYPSYYRISEQHTDWLYNTDCMLFLLGLFLYRLFRQSLVSAAVGVHCTDVKGERFCPQRKILPETAQPPDLSAFRKVCTNFHGRRGDRRLRNCHWLSWPECVRCLLLFSISLSISFEILSSVILAYPWVVLIFECPIILAMLSIDTLSEIRRTPNP